MAPLSALYRSDERIPEGHLSLAAPAAVPGPDSYVQEVQGAVDNVRLRDLDAPLVAEEQRRLHLGPVRLGQLLQLAEAIAALLGFHEA